MTPFFFFRDVDNDVVLGRTLLLGAKAPYHIMSGNDPVLSEGFPSYEVFLNSSFVGVVFDMLALCQCGPLPFRRPPPFARLPSKP